MSLTLTRDAVPAAYFEGSQQHSWPVRITAASSEAGLEPAIFVYHVVGSDKATSEDIFECVASVQQMTELPANAPQPDATKALVPYYRKNILEIACRSAEEADELWDRVQEDVIDLLANFRAFANMQATAVVTIP